MMKRRYTSAVTILTFPLILSLFCCSESFVYPTPNSRARCRRLRPSLILSLKAAHDDDDDASFNSCIVLYDDDDTGISNDHDHQKKNNNCNNFLADAKNISKELGIPLMFTSNVTFSIRQLQQQREQHSGVVFTHALRLIPYEYTSVEDAPFTFALAIESMNSDEQKDGGGQSRRRPRKSSSSSSPFFVDLCPPKSSRAGRRAQGLSGTSDLLVQAVAPNKGSAITNNDDSDNARSKRVGAIIFDCTAGFGQDSLVLAMNGANHVHMIERNPIVAALLQDALRRLKFISTSTLSSSSSSSSVSYNDFDRPYEQRDCTERKQMQHQKGHQTQKELATHLLQKLSLTVGDATDIINNSSNPCCDIMYLDPMFPPRQKRSAVKKGMQILHSLLETQRQSVDSDDKEGNNNAGSIPIIKDKHDKNDYMNININEREIEEHDLLLTALKAVKLRVVVKRPIKSPILGGTEIIKPSYSINGSVNRWDVYVKPPPQ